MHCFEFSRPLYHLSITIESVKTPQVSMFFEEAQEKTLQIAIAIVFESLVREK